MSKKTKTRLLIGAIILLIPTIGLTMSFFKDAAKSIVKGNIVTFSPVSGVVKYKGEVVANAKIIRRVSDKDDKAEDDFTVTDENGHFEMPARYGRKKSLMQEVYAWQYIIVEHNNKEIQIWENTKMLPEENTELDGLPISLNCELTSSEKGWETPIGFRFITRCEIDNFDGTMYADFGDSSQ
ncbi:MAG: hypothetical protein ACI93R_001493 [Flavobacteriales bacterium]|jgi:hypothetical protein